MKYASDIQMLRFAATAITSSETGDAIATWLSFHDRDHREILVEFTRRERLGRTRRVGIPIAGMQHAIPGTLERMVHVTGGWTFDFHSGVAPR